MSRAEPSRAEQLSSRASSPCLAAQLVYTPMCRYKLPDGFSLSVPFGEAHSCQARFVTLYEDALMAGLRLPLHALVRDCWSTSALLLLTVFKRLEILDGGYSFMALEIRVWAHPPWVPLDLLALHSFWGASFFFLTTRLGRKIIDKVQTSNKG